MTPEESFEPIVMFFGLINSVAMFQMMINKILQDLINTDKIIKRLAENNLYVRPEKYK